jgi:hypothetical protein
MSRAQDLINQIKRKSTVDSTYGKMADMPKPQKVPAIQLSPEAQRKKIAFEKLEAELEKFVETQTSKLKSIKRDVESATIKYRESLYLAMANIYNSYLEIEESPHSDDFYANLRGYLKSKDIRTQANSTDVGLIIRYVFGPIKPKSINDYGNALLEAQLQGVNGADFPCWLKRITITKASQSYQQREKKGESREAKIQRARILVLRMMDVFENRPIAAFSMNAWATEQQVHSGSDMIFMVARGVRRFDRESHIADVRVCFFIPPGIDFEHIVINRLAKHLYTRIDQWEAKLAKVEEVVWAGDLYNYLSDREAEAAEKSRQQWTERMEAAMDMDRGMT